jgi:hypothetical protein
MSGVVARPVAGRTARSKGRGAGVVSGVVAPPLAVGGARSTGRGRRALAGVGARFVRRGWMALASPDYPSPDGGGVWGVCA